MVCVFINIYIEMVNTVTVQYAYVNGFVKDKCDLDELKVLMEKFDPKLDHPKLSLSPKKSPKKKNPRGRKALRERISETRRVLFDD